MRQLIKYFSSHSYAKMFQGGKIYMNSLSWFWENGFEDQRDLFEGITASVDKKRLGLPPFWQQLINGDILFRLDAYRYCNLSCFYRVDISDTPDLSICPNAPKFYRINMPNKAMDRFGNTVAIIKNEQEFIRRVLTALESDWRCICGDVIYKPYPGSANLQGGNTNWGSINQYPISKLPLKSEFPTMKDCFVKHIQYRSQNEWRICLFRNQKDDCHYILDVGDLSDIVDLVPSDNIVKRLAQMYSPCFAHHVPPQIGPFQGNITRTAFQRMLLDFDGGLGTLALSM